MDYGNTKITQHALEVSEFSCIMLKWDTIRKKKKKKKEEEEEEEEETETLLQTVRSSPGQGPTSSLSVFVG